jgi:hypothetical protein
MKPSFCLVLTLALGAGLYSTGALAQDAAAAAAAQTGMAPDAALAAAQTSHRPAHRVRAHHHVHGYDKCLQEKLAAAQHYCDSHADSCQAEKDGAAKQCRSEARGERQTG